MNVGGVEINCWAKVNAQRGYLQKGLTAQITFADFKELLLNLLTYLYQNSELQ